MQNSTLRVTKFLPRLLVHLLSDFMQDIAHERLFFQTMIFP